MLSSGLLAATKTVLNPGTRSLQRGFRAWSQMFRRQLASRLKSQRRSCGIESLESRQLLTTTLYVDFGDGFTGGQLTLTQSELASAPINGPTFDPTRMNDRITFRRFNDVVNVDSNRDGTINAADDLAIRQDIMETLNRIYEPFDVLVVELTAGSRFVDNIPVAGATNAASIGQILGANNMRAKKSDAYIIVGECVWTSTGLPEAGIYGLANGIDLTLQSNQNDDTAIVATQQFLADVAASQYSVDQLGKAIGNVIAHESGHILGLRHTFNGRHKSVSLVSGTGDTGRQLTLNGITYQRLLPGTAAISVRGNIFLQRGNDLPQSISLRTGSDLLVEDQDRYYSGIINVTVRPGSSYDAVRDLSSISLSSTLWYAVTQPPAGTYMSSSVWFNADTDAYLMGRSVLMQAGSVPAAVVSDFFIPRQSVLRDYNEPPVGSTVVSLMEQFFADSQIGRRANNTEYIYGTGAHDYIVVTFDAQRNASISVQSFRDASRTNLITRSQYSVPASIGTLKIFGGDGEDVIAIMNAGIESSSTRVEAFGGNGNDQLIAAAPSVMLNFRGEDGNDFLSNAGVQEGGRGNDVLSSGQTIVYQGNYDLGWDTVYPAAAATIDFANFPWPVTFDSSRDVQTVSATRLSISVYNNLFQDIVGSQTAPNVLYGNLNSNTIFGGAANDVIFAMAGDDVIQGRAGNDQLDGGAGKDNLDGGPGNDTLRGSDGNDALYGRDGDDLVSGGNGTDTIEGNGGNDRLEGGADDDVFLYVRTNLGIEANFGSDTIHEDQDAGVDTVNLAGMNFGPVTFDLGSTLTQTLNGGCRITLLTDRGIEDVIGETRSSNTLIGNARNNQIIGGNLNDFIDGRSGNDRLFGRSGWDVLIGEDGNDSLYGEGGSDTLCGRRGNDWLQGGNEAGDTYLYEGILLDHGADTIFDGNGADFTDIVDFTPFPAPVRFKLHLTDTQTVTQANGASLWITLGNTNSIATVRGSAFIDVIVGNSLKNTIFGGGGDDSLWGGSENDSIYGGAGNDKIYGDTGNDLLNGEDGNDTVSGDGGDDTVLGGSGDDFLYGGAGIDRLFGELGLDFLDAGGQLGDREEQ